MNWAFKKAGATGISPKESISDTIQLNKEKAAALRFRSGMSKPWGRGGRRYLPYAFSEQGLGMLSGVL
jgi:hypothetical protein